MPQHQHLASFPSVYHIYDGCCSAEDIAAACIAACDLCTDTVCRALSSDTDA